MVGWAPLEFPFREFIVRDKIGYMLNTAHHLWIIDLNDPNSPVVLSSFDLDDSSYYLCLIDETVYLGSRGGFSIVDVSDVTNPSLVGHLEFPGGVWRLDVRGDYAYLTDDRSYFKIVDISNPELPHVVGELDGGDRSTCSALNWPYVYVSVNFFGYHPPIMQVIDVTNPANPQLVRNIPYPFAASRMIVVDHFLLVGTYLDGIHVFDISNPEELVQVERIQGFDKVFDMALEGERLVVCDSGLGFHVLDVSDFPNITRSRISILGDRSLNVSIDDNLAYFNSYRWNITTVDLTVNTEQDPLWIHNSDFSHRHMRVKDRKLFSLTRNDQGYSVGFDVFRIDGQGSLHPMDHLSLSYAVGNYDLAGQYAYLAMYSQGLWVVDISHPGDLRVVGSVDIPKTGKDVAIKGGWAYMGTGGNSNHEGWIEIINIHDPENPVATARYSYDSRVSHLRVLNNTLIAQLQDGRMLVFDIKENKKIRRGRLVNEGVSIPAEIFPPRLELLGEVDFGFHPPWDFLVDGKIAFCISYHELGIADFTNPAQPELLASWELPVSGWGRTLAYRNGILYAGTVQTGVLVYDVRDLNEPKLLGFFEAPKDGIGLAAGPQGVYCSNLDGQIQVAPLQCINTIGPEQWQFPSEDEQVVGSEYGTEIPPELWLISPNPFNPKTTISFISDQFQRVRVVVYDIRGHEVCEITNQEYGIGEHLVEWQGRDSSGRSMPSGEYFFLMNLGGQVEVRKAMLVR